MSDDVYPNDLRGELSRSLGLISHYMDQLINEKRPLFGIPLSVELRKLYSQDRGDRLLERVQDKFNIKLKYKVIHKPPNQYKEVGIKEYINGLAFVYNGRTYTKIQVIEYVADQRGAHVDDNLNEFHLISRHIRLPWKNLSKSGLMLQSDLHQIMTIAEATLFVADKQLRKILTVQ